MKQLTDTHNVGVKEKGSDCHLKNGYFENRQPSRNVGGRLFGTTNST